MEHLNKKEEICRKVAENFRFAGKITKMSPYGSGHINDTFMLTCELEDGSNKHYILQRMNDDIFRNPKELMENVVNVTTFLRKKIIAAGGDPERETLNIILTKDGANYLQDETGDYWRSYVFIDDATCFDLVEKPEDFYNSAVAFGHFQQLLYQLRTALAHRHRSQRTIAGVGIRAKDHLAAACEHFSCKLVDNRLMRRYINAAVFFCTSQSE